MRYEYIFCFRGCWHPVSQVQNSVHSIVPRVRNIIFAQEAGSRAYQVYLSEGGRVIYGGLWAVSCGTGWRYRVSICSYLLCDPAAGIFSRGLPARMYVHGIFALTLCLLKAASQVCMYTSHQIYCCTCCAEHGWAAFPCAFNVRS